VTALYANYPSYRPEGESAIRGPARRVKMLVAGAAARRDAGPAVARAAWSHATRLLEELGGRTVPVTTSHPLSLPRDAAILDYGAGAGSWLRVMLDRGYRNLWAYDLDNDTLRDLERLGIAVATPSRELPRASFDCVRLEHVLEHVVDPVDCLRRLRTALRPGGVVVLVVPNYGCWSARVSGPRWPALYLPHHLWHFTEASLRHVASAAGLRVARVVKQPMAELALGAAQQRPAPGAGAAPRASLPGWRLRYHRWARRRDDGEFLGGVLVASDDPAGGSAVSARNV
jgi:SAM-dependent methyltransferase